MARRRGRGGYQAPSKPAATSGPGALSARTDGGPGQPVRVAPGGDYGDRKALVSQQQGAPMATSGGGPRPVQGGGPRPVQSPQGIFGPSDRPSEAMTAGVDWGPGVGAAQPIYGEDPYAILRALVNSKYSTPHLERLLARMSRG